MADFFYLTLTTTTQMRRRPPDKKKHAAKKIYSIVCNCFCDINLYAVILSSVSLEYEH